MNKISLLQGVNYSIPESNPILAKNDTTQKVEIAGRNIQISEPETKEQDTKSLEDKFYIRLKVCSTTTGDLFKDIPKTLNLEQIVDYIFKECYGYRIVPLLNAILIAHPSFTLSPFNKIRKAIVEDDKHLLTNQSIMKMLKEHHLHNDLAKLSACYDLAFRLHHPGICQLSDNSVSTEDYSLNVLWVNLNPQDRIKDVAQSIFKEGLDETENAESIQNPKVLLAFEEGEKKLTKEELVKWEAVKRSFAYRISKWADIHPKAQINLWYDSALVTKKAQLKTFQMMKAISESRGVNLQLRDIRTLPSLVGEIENIFHPGTPVYVRVDLAKVLISDHMVSCKGGAKYCVVTDIDVEPMPPQQIFDQRTLGFLSQHGCVFNCDNQGYLENSFFIFNREKEDPPKVQRETIIQAMASKLTVLRKYPKNASGLSLLDSQAIFAFYSDFKRRMGWKFLEDFPVKVVKCPGSQFNPLNSFSEKDHQSETFRFIDNSNIPYTRNGRGYNQSKSEEQIKELVDWVAEPLT